MRRVIIGTHARTGQRIVVGPVRTDRTVAELRRRFDAERYTDVAEVDYYSVTEFRAGAHRPLASAPEGEDQAEERRRLEAESYGVAEELSASVDARAEDAPAAPSEDGEPSARADETPDVDELDVDVEPSAPAAPIEDDDVMCQRCGIPAEDCNCLVSTILEPGPLPALHVVSAGERRRRDVVDERIDDGPEPPFVDAAPAAADPEPVDPVAYLARELALADLAAGENELVPWEELPDGDRHHYVCMARILIRRGVVPIEPPTAETPGITPATPDSDDFDADGPLAVRCGEYIDLTVAGSTVAALTSDQARDLAAELIRRAGELEAQGGGR